MDPIELAASTARLRARFEQVLVEHRSLLARVGGNFLIHIPSVATWTIVTSGPRIGLHDGATDDEIAFALSCDAEVLGELFASRGQLDVEPHLSSGRLRVDGDLEVYQRFLALGAPAKSALSIRSGD